LQNEYLVTGCAGFIGSHLTDKLLADGHSVIGIDNFDPFYNIALKKDNLSNALKSKNFQFIEADLKNADSFEIFPVNVDCVIHLAAKAGVRPSILNPQDYIASNIVATENILSWMKEKKIQKILFASSSSVYGNNLKTPFSETDNTDFPISPYAYTKKSCELLLHTYHHLYQIDVINLRFFTVYGPRQRPDLAIRKFIELIKNDQPINIYGDGSTGRDYTYVDDTVKGVINSLEYIMSHTGVFEIINLGNSNPIKLSELVNTIYNCLGKTPNIIKYPMQPGDVELTYADISKAKSLINYSPTTSLVHGINSVIKWIDNK
jgi:UDP-glucuronate 4-epimerase